jgi:hypothetical protein
MGTLHGSIDCDLAGAAMGYAYAATLGGRDVQLVHSGTVCAGFETPGLMLDKDHSLRHLMGQLLLGQLEARFSLFR